jgi:hypothetical protein
LILEQNHFSLFFFIIEISKEKMLYHQFVSL